MEICLIKKNQPRDPRAFDFCLMWNSNASEDNSLNFPRSINFRLIGFKCQASQAAPVRHTDIRRELVINDIAFSVGVSIELIFYVSLSGPSNV